LTSTNKHHYPKDHDTIGRKLTREAEAIILVLILPLSLAKIYSLSSSMKKGLGFLILKDHTSKIPPNILVEFSLGI
jgi:hypothetical protein